MTSTRRYAIAVVVAVLGAACATSVAPSGGGGTAGGTASDAGATTDAAGYGNDDSGVFLSPDASTKSPGDAGKATPIDGGSTGPVDSGTTSTPDLCSGTTSTYRDSRYHSYSYDDWCDDDYYYEHEHLPCASNDDCLGVFNVDSCCYQPPDDESSLCYSDTHPNGTPQCVPQ